MILNTDMHRMGNVGYLPPKCVCTERDKAHQEWKKQRDLADFIRSCRTTSSLIRGVSID